MKRFTDNLLVAYFLGHPIYVQEVPRHWCRLWIQASKLFYERTCHRSPLDRRVRFPELVFVTIAIAGPSNADNAETVELTWTHSKRYQHCPASTSVDATWPKKKRMTKEHLANRPGKGDMDSRI